MRLFFVLFMISSLANAQSITKWGFEKGADDLPQGLEEGSMAPQIQLQTADGQSFSLENQLKKGPVVVIFYRGVWCGHCQRYLSAVQDSLQFMLDKGVYLVAVTPETKENALKTKGNTRASFPILLDENDEVMKSYDVDFQVSKSYQNKIALGKMTSIAEANKQEEASLPVPATYIIDEKGVIRFVHFDYNYRYDHRASVKKILEELEDL